MGYNWLYMLHIVLLWFIVCYFIYSMYFIILCIHYSLFEWINFIYMLYFILVILINLFFIFISFVSFSCFIYLAFSNIFIVLLLFIDFFVFIVVFGLLCCCFLFCLNYFFVYWSVFLFFTFFYSFSLSLSLSLYIYIMQNVSQWKTTSTSFINLIDKRSTFSLSLTHAMHCTALFTCERALSTVFGTRDNSRIIIYIYIYIYYIFYIYIYIVFYFLIYICI